LPTALRWIAGQLHPSKYKPLWVTATSGSILEVYRQLLAELDHAGLLHVVLAHLSRENNTPERALSTVGNALRRGRTALCVAIQDRCGDMLYI